MNVVVFCCGWRVRWGRRHAAVAARPGGSDPQREGAGRPLLTHLQGYHRAETADRRRRPERRPVYQLLSYT